MDSMKINLGQETKTAKTAEGKSAKITKSAGSAKENISMNPKKKKILCISTLVAGLIMLAVGAVFLVLNLTRGSVAQDGEYLVSAEKWVLTDCNKDDCNKVIWDFTEIGKGVLTTDGGEHQYDFIWALEGKTLKIETDWLYELENEYTYELDQGAEKLTLTDADEKEFVLSADFENK